MPPSVVKALLAQLQKFISSAGNLALIARLLEKVIPAKLRPFAKAVLPAGLSLVAYVVLALTSGKWDGVALNTLVAGLLGSLISYLVPNVGGATTVRATITGSAAALNAAVESAAAPTPSLITQYDSIDPNAIPADAVAVAGYVGGRWPDYSALVKRFPKARHKSVAISDTEDADILDIENGDAKPEKYPAWHRRQVARGVKMPGPYANASTMPAVVAACDAAGIKPEEYVRWDALWDGVATLASTPGAACKQIIDHGPHGENYDVSVADPAFWGETVAHYNPPHYERFAIGPFRSKYGSLNERNIVERYDGARKHPLLYAAYLKFYLQPRLLFLAQRVAEVAIHLSPQADGRPSWGVDSRGWRYQQLIHRAKGQRFA